MHRALLLGLTLLAPCLGCTSLHHAQIDEIDAQQGRLVPFEIHASETGLNTKAIGNIASAAARSHAPAQVAAIVSLFQFGPRTGNIVYSDTFADGVAVAILDRCPSARVTGLVSLRESTSYYAVSGEYVTVRGYCIVD